MRRIFALALVLCAGCSWANSDLNNELFGDVRSLLPGHDSGSTGPVSAASLGYTSNTPPITARPQAGQNP